MYARAPAQFSEDCIVFHLRPVGTVGTCVGARADVVDAVTLFSYHRISFHDLSSDRVEDHETTGRWHADQSTCGPGGVDGPYDTR